MGAHKRLQFALFNAKISKLIFLVEICNAQVMAVIIVIFLIFS